MLLLNPYFSFDYFLFGFSFNQRFLLCHHVLAYSMFFLFVSTEVLVGEVVFSSSQFPCFSQRPFFIKRVVLYSTKFIFVEHVFLDKHFFQFSIMFLF